MLRTSTVVMLIALAAGCAAQSKDQSMKDNPHRGQLRHVVLFKFKPGTPPEKVREIEQGFGRLPDRIPQIVGYEWGTNISPEGHDKGYTHAFLVTFADTAGRDAYLPHPAHKEFVDLLLPHLEEAHVIDYIVRD